MCKTLNFHIHWIAMHLPLQKFIIIEYLKRDTIRHDPKISPVTVFQIIHQNYYLKLTKPIIPLNTIEFGQKSIAALQYLLSCCTHAKKNSKEFWWKPTTLADER